MKYIILLLFLFASCSASREVFSQGLHTSSGKALDLYKKGVQSFDYFDFNKAEVLFKEALERDNKFFEAYLMLGELYTKQKKYREAADNYLAAVNIDSVSYKPVYLYLANAEMYSEDYKNALIHYKTYLRNKEGSAKNRQLSARNIKNCEFAIEAIKNPVPFNPVSAGPSINTQDDEYWPSITADGQTLMFTRQVYSNHYATAIGSSQEDFYLSYFSENGWQKAFPAGEPLNTKNNEGAQTLSSNGKYMYFTACDKSGGLGSCDIYFSSYSNGGWSVPFNLGWPVNTAGWESTPSISADGNLLIFSSNRPGGSGGKDLWYSVITNKGTWANPVNIGKTINTEVDEMSPFIHFDGKTLYFASDGRPGMGGLDIYMSRRIDDTTWSEPQNLGHPINTSSDEMGLIIDAGGQKAYFSSKRDNQNGKDIFCFIPDESFRPDPVSYLKGKVADRLTGKYLKADYELINLTLNKVTVVNKTDDEGNFLVCLPSGNNYGLNVSKTGYLFYSENFMFEGLHSAVEPLVKRINLSPLIVGEKMQLSNVFYEVDSWKLKEESVAELNNLAELLHSAKDLIVEIGGYTDSTGTDGYNLALSEKRARSVVDYLVSRGIASERLKFNGYGNSSPIGNNITPEGRKLNRRTEMKIIGLQQK